MSPVATTNIGVGPTAATVLPELQKITGRPVGTTNTNKYFRHTAIVAAKNEITIEYMNVKERNKGKKLEYNCLKNIIEKVKAKRNLVDTEIKSTTIMRRIQRKKPMATGRPGPDSPLAAVESKVVAICIQMANIQMLLTVSFALSLS